MKIICIARNYRAHIEELDGFRQDSETARDDYVDEKMSRRCHFFMKPDTALLRGNDPFYVPDFSDEVDYECELVVRINRVGRAIAQKFAHRYYDEVGLGIDFTARDLQREAIAKGLPWEACKSFDRSAALSPRFLKLGKDSEDSEGRDDKDNSLWPLTVQNLRFEMQLNGEIRQKGHTADMIFTVDEIIAHISRFVTLKIGDLIFTGTPAGIGPVRPGDRLTASLEGRTLLDFLIK